MAKCDYCASSILFAGSRQGTLRFCNDSCRRLGAVLSASSRLPDNVVQQRVWSIHHGSCPRCGGSGPVDVHTSHRVWSALVITKWSSKLQVSCRSCGVKQQLSNAATSLVLGWWGFPWGLVMTPVQVSRNLVGVFRGSDASKPSAQLEKLVRMGMMAGDAPTSPTAKNA